jgi:hypothetical protein
VCKSKFEAKYSSLQLVCSAKCAYEYGRKQVEKKNKEAKKEAKEKLLTHKDYLKMLQVVFNNYIRLRDKDKPCISCDKPLKDKYDAGHYFSVGGYPNVRFDEFNVWAQCVYCNQHKRGAIHEYTQGLIKRIGETEFNLLRERAYQMPLKLSILEIKEKIKYYKLKIKELKM